jgi:hypothetical protein
LTSTTQAVWAGAPSAEARRAAGSGTLNVRWIGGGVVEVATPDEKQLAYIDAAVFAPTIAPTYDAFHVSRPTEFTSADNFTSYVHSKSPDAVLVLLSHDHPDHAGTNQQEFIDLLKGLSGAGINVKATGQSDLFRSPTGLLPKFQAAGLDPVHLLVNDGAAQNFGGHAQLGQMQVWLVQATTPMAWASRRPVSCWRWAACASTPAATPTCMATCA